VCKGQHLPGSLLFLIPSYSTNDGVLLAYDTIHGTLGVATCLGGLGLSLTGRMLFLAALLPGRRAGRVADRLDDCALDGVVLTGSLGGDIVCRGNAESEV